MYLYSKIDRPLFLVLTCAVSNMVFSAPIIDTVSIDDGTGDLVILGNGFGAGPEVIVYDDFESGQDANQIDLNSPPLGAWSGYGWYGGTPTYVREADGNTAMRARDTSISLASMSRISQVEIEFPSSNEKFFMAFSVKVPKGTTFAGASAEREFPDVSSWKFSWALAGSDAFQDEGLDLTLPSHVGGGSFTLGGNDGNITWLNRGGGWWSWNQFNHIAVGIDLAQEQSVEYFWRAANENGIYRDNGLSDKSSLKASPMNIDRVGFPGWWGNGDNEKFDGYYDNIYVATGNQYLARLEISNAERIEDSTDVIVVPPKSWSDSNITIDSRIFMNRESWFIHVVDGEGQRTTVGSSICERCPDTVKEILVE